MMLAHDIVGKKEDRERENTIHYWCEIYGVICMHTTENLDKWIQVASYYRQSILQVYCFFISLHISLIIIVTIWIN